MIEVIHLNKVLWTYKAYDGTFCCMPYPNHPKGCPKFPKCIEDNQLEFYSPTSLSWYAVIEEFDLETHAKKMKELHPKWTDRQCKCVLYWQPTVKKKLFEKAQKAMYEIGGCCLTLCPEALGVNVFGTMAKEGIILYKNPKLVRKIAFIGKVKEFEKTNLEKF